MDEIKQKLAQLKAFISAATAEASLLKNKNFEDMRKRLVTEWSLLRNWQERFGI